MLLIIRETQITTLVSYHLTPDKMDLIKKKMTVGKNV